MKLNKKAQPLVQLYTTSACHLCELAEALLHDINIEATSVEIADDDALVTRYGIRIPVLKRLDTQTELNWPFTSQDIMEFIQ
jgi:hypothetical protein